MIVETNIPVFSQCAHHHQQILGTCHLGYIPGDSKQVMGLSKLNRIVEHFSRRGQIQEDLTMQIFNTLNTVIPDNLGVAVVVDSKHSCVSCRGVKHQGASMQTAKLSGAFLQEPECREEFYMYVRNAVSKC
jgi:GTP cyclohydrolase I